MPTSRFMTKPKITVNSNHILYTQNNIYAQYTYEKTEATQNNDQTFTITPKSQNFIFKTNRKIPKLGIMLVGLGGNNGTTVAAGIIANRQNITWNTKNGLQHANYLGSLTQSSTLRIGNTPKGEEIYAPFNSLLPMIHPNEIAISGWDLSSLNLKKAMQRAQVIDYDLQQKIGTFLEEITPLKAIYYPDFIAANQIRRVDHVLEGNRASSTHLEHLRRDIREFKQTRDLDKVIVLWTANTERFCEIIPGINDTEENLMKAITEGHPEVSPSQMYAMAALLENCSYINGSPQNTFVPGIMETAKRKGLFIAGDDFKSGQTKMKSVLVDFLVSAGLKPESIVSYNHLGNNDGKNLAAPKQFRSKEISKSNVVDDIISSNSILYQENEKPDHTVVIKYVPFVQDSKRAMDEYNSSIFLNGLNTIVLHNTCEDSLLAAPLIIDLVILTELFERVFCASGNNMKELNEETVESLEFRRMDSVLSVLAYLLKAPQVPKGTPVINALFKQRSCIENCLRAFIGLPPENHMLLEYKFVVE